jgi:26S proteasome regulatory subunit N5
MLQLEKQYRLSADFVATPRLCVAILSVLREQNDWDGLCEHVVLLSKRRAQLKQAIAAIVREAMTYIDETPTVETKTKLIETLNEVASGKIFVEVEKARLTRILAKLHEDSGRISEAASVMQEVAIETYGALSKREKVFFIEEQIRLCMKNEDFVRARILSRKINPRSFDEIKKTEEKELLKLKKKKLDEDGTGDQMMDDSEKKRMEEVEKEEKKEKESAVQHAKGVFAETDASVPDLPNLRFNYHQLMVQYFEREKNYLEQCRCYKAILECELVKEDREKYEPAMESCAWLVILSEREPMQQSLLHETLNDERLKEMKVYKDLLKKFTTYEIIRWDELSEQYAEEISKHFITNNNNNYLTSKSNINDEDVVVVGDSKTSKLEDLQSRVIEHNLFVIAKYYKRISLSRLSELLCLSIDEAEQRLSKSVCSKKVLAKIDRPNAIASFKKTTKSNEETLPDALLNSWVENVDTLLFALDKATQLINKEAMTFKVSLESY